jgi:hypothetical protein
LGQFESAFGEDVAREFKRQVSALESIEGVSMEDQIEALYDRFSAGMTGDVQKMADLNTIFGKRTVTSMLLMLAEGSEGLKKYSKDLQDATGAAENIANAMRGSIKNRIAVLGSALTELGFKFVESFKDKGVDVISKLTETVNNFDVTPLVNMAQSAADAVVKFAGFLGGAIKTAWEFRGVILAIVAPLAIYQGALMTITIVTGIYAKVMAVVRVITGIVTGAQMAYAIVVQGNTAATAALAFVSREAAVATGIWSFVMKAAIKIQKTFAGKTILQTAAIAGQTIATGVATAAQWAFNAALTANPIGIIIVAIGALIGIIILLAKNWDKVTTTIKNHANKVMAILTVLFGPIGFIISMIKEIASNWGKIKEALAATGLFDKLREIGGAIKDFIGDKIEWLVSLWDKVKNAVGGFFSYVINGIKSFFEPAITWITNAWQTATSAVCGFFKGIFDVVYNFVKPALDFFAEKWQQIVSFFKDNAIINAIKVIGGALLSGMIVPIQGLLEILSHIPGLGHLAGKGADKIEEFRNFLKGVDGATVTADVNVPDEVNAKLTPPVDTGAPIYNIPGFDIPDFDIPDLGNAVKSKLHGVVDISGGAIPGFSSPLPDRGTYTANSAVENATPAAPGMAELITTNVIGIAAVLRKIDNSVSFIARSLPVSARSEFSVITVPAAVTRTSFAPPRIRMGGDEGANDYLNPRDIAPVTQAERMAYSLQERRETVVIEVAAEKGTAARIVRAPRDVDIQLVSSGGNA